MDQFDEENESKVPSVTRTQSTDVDVIPIPPKTRSFLINLLEDANVLPRTHRVNLGPMYFDVSIEDILPGTQEKQVQKLYQSFDKFYFTRLIQDLSEDQYMQFSHLLDLLDAAEDPNEIQRYYVETEEFPYHHIPYAQEVIAEIFFEFRHLYLDQVAKSRVEETAE